jgi:tRNA threonylcarbamoyladenosine biosynthesis protein TsaE
VTLTASSLSELPAIASQILSHAGNNRVFLFHGDMGAGKTTLIKALCQCLDTNEPATSPTFAIVNEYSGKDIKVYHFDFYRIKTQTEALDMGCEEYFYSGNYCFIEWPEKIPDMLPLHYTAITIRELSNNMREITIEKT